MSQTSKSPRKVLLVAYAVAKDALPAYAHRFSPKKFTQHQLFACLVLKEFLKTDYRGVAALLIDCCDLRQAIELNRVPHFTTLQKASDRLLRQPSLRWLMDATIDRAIQKAPLKPKVNLAAIDSTGFEAHRTSHYFVRRRAKGGQLSGKWQSTTYRRFPKLAVLCDTKSHFILAAHCERGPRPDFGHFERVLFQALWRVRIGTLAADAGYDAEWIHQLCRSNFGMCSLIPAAIGRPTTRAPTAYFRRWMWSHLHQTRYGQRWQAETVISMIKRRTGSALAAHGHWRQHRAAMLKVLTHNIMILKSLPNVFYRAGVSPFFCSPIECVDGRVWVSGPPS